VRQGAFGSQILGIGTPDLALKVLLANGHTRIYTKGVGAESGARGKPYRRMSYCDQAHYQRIELVRLRDILTAKMRAKHAATAGKKGSDALMLFLHHTHGIR